MNQSKHGKARLNGFWETHYLEDLDRIDGKQLEFEWTIFPGFTTLQILGEIQNMMTETQCEPEQFQGRMIFMSMYNDIVWGEKGNEELWIANFKIVEDSAKRFAHDIGRFLDLDQKRNGTELVRTNRMENGIESLRA